MNQNSHSRFFRHRASWKVWNLLNTTEESEGSDHNCAHCAQGILTETWRNLIRERQGEKKAPKLVSFGTLSCCGKSFVGAHPDRSKKTEGHKKRWERDEKTKKQMISKNGKKNNNEKQKIEKK